MSTRRGFLFGLAALPFAPTVAKATPVENLVLSDLTQQDMVQMVRNLAFQMYQDSIYSANAPDRMIVTDPELAKALDWNEDAVTPCSFNVLISDAKLSPFDITKCGNWGGFVNGRH